MDITFLKPILPEGEIINGVPCGESSVIFEAIPSDTVESYLTDHPKSTLYIRVRGQSMEGDDILDGDMLTIDRVTMPLEGDAVLVYTGGEYLVKQHRPTAEPPGLYNMPASGRSRHIPLHTASIVGVVVSQSRRRRSRYVVEILR